MEHGIFGLSFSKDYIKQVLNAYGIFLLLYHNSINKPQVSFSTYKEL